jgi:pantoate--beta-alanine ligase
VEVFSAIEGLRRFLQPPRQAGQRIALVPTMGFLHEGHLSLVRAAKAENDIVITSIFVNPTQFGPAEDYSRYPRDEARDTSLLEAEGVHAVLLPSVATMYPQGNSTAVLPPTQSEGWCGEKRPGHFQGVCSVVAMLFNIVQPDRAYFGEKDAQQLAVIRQMTQDLHFPIEIIGCPIVRDPDGLALSSRNVYLSAAERADALVLSQALYQGLALFQAGERSAARILDAGRAQIEAKSTIRLDYLGIVDQNTFKAIATVREGAIFLGAIHAGKTRLIDNMRF